MDSHKAAFWGKVFKDIKVHEEIQINSSFHLPPITQAQQGLQN